MFFPLEVLPTTRHPGYPSDHENDGKNGKYDDVEHDSVHHTARARSDAFGARAASPLTNLGTIAHAITY
jgi:hypothetical protein